MTSFKEPLAVPLNCKGVPIGWYHNNGANSLVQMNSSPEVLMNSALQRVIVSSSSNATMTSEMAGSLDGI